jgi:hypothetical protein
LRIRATVGTDPVSTGARHHPALHIEYVDGPHHVHLEHAPRVADLIREFLELG